MFNCKYKKEDVDIKICYLCWNKSHQKKIYKTRMGCKLNNFDFENFLSMIQKKKQIGLPISVEEKKIIDEFKRFKILITKETKTFFDKDYFEHLKESHTC